MSTVAERPRARRASAPPAPAAPVRHGKCSLHLSIGGTRYRLQPITPPAGFKLVWSLRKQAETDSAVYQVAIAKGQQPGCTCPDFTINGAVCKHVGALKALGLIPGRKARPAAARRSHARRLAESAEAPAPAPASAPQPAGAFATGFRSAVSAEIRRMSGQVEPETEPEGCLFCGDPFDPAISRDPHFCASCAAEGGAR
jgi:SWIM zinc finger